MAPGPGSARRPVRLAVVGGRRGQSLDGVLPALRDLVRLVAICDTDREVLAGWRDRVPGCRTYDRYDDLLADRDVDAVLLATPLRLHARQAVAALEAGRHVLSEVTAAHTLEDCRALVEAVERTGYVYMLAENYCFMRPNLMVENMAARGLFGRVTHAEGGYLHDCRQLLHHRDGSLTWRGEGCTSADSVGYPTHSLGPVARWLRAANGPDERFETLTAASSAVRAVPDYFARRFGPDHPGARESGFWRQGDTATALIRTTSGAVVTIRVDYASARPHNMTHYGLQGTGGAYLSARHGGEDPLVWVDGLSPGRSEGLPGQEPARWEPLWAHAGAYEHPLWREWSDDALAAGHGGGDYFVIREFATAVATGRRPAVDVYDAVTWSCVAPLSAESIAGGGVPVPFPDFS